MSRPSGVGFDERGACANACEAAPLKRLPIVGVEAPAVVGELEVKVSHTMRKG
ncbi:MAG: hypothetical protein QOJ70_3438 [Acidobacteriota bacterium]|jgi:hypothetical protein|nr:hypothetical protein [Acidobacteriota bacterium]